MSELKLKNQEITDWLEKFDRSDIPPCGWYEVNGKRIYASHIINNLRFQLAAKDKEIERANNIQGKLDKMLTAVANVMCTDPKCDKLRIDLEVIKEKKVEPSEPPQGSGKGKLKLTGKTFFSDQTDGFYGPKD